MKPGMIEKKILLTERIGVTRSREYVRVGVPFAKGELLNAGELSLLSSEREEQPLQATPLNRWNDGSIKWALLDFAATVPPRGQATYNLVSLSGENRKTSCGIRVTPGKDAWQVDTGVAVFSIDAKEFRPFVCVTNFNGEILAAEGSCSLLTADKNRPVPQIESIVVEAEGSLRTVLTVRGHFMGTGKEIARFFCRLHFFADSSCVQLDFTIHNPHSARHSGGLWDLGDPKSFLFRELTLELNFPKGNITEILCSPEPGIEPIRCDETEGSLSLYQESSGGENWLSPAHRTRDGEVAFTLKGYEVCRGDKQVAMGTRATPLFWCGSGSSGVSVVLPRFWQEFPKAIDAQSRNLKIALFPGRFPHFHELQGGEQKTHKIHLDFAAHPGTLEWARSPLTATASPEVVQHAGVIADFPLVDYENKNVKSLVEQFISGPEEFLRKREAIDEYGWRNFGELYADHEAVYHKGAEPFVSHYNNQYDPCAGMYRMFLATGNPLWGELASDLARHVLDIDIYHTSEDREEYNNGLFWHTDHYVAVGLATHRSFSLEQIGNRDPRFCGGGPGAEHCYTTGLMLHYFLTGDPDARDAVVGLAEWCYRSLHGSHTVMATIKNSISYLSLLRSADKNNPPLFPRFPLTRGTGNAISSCVDAYEVSGNCEFLHLAGELIRGALHPDDDIDARDLLNSEVAWSYTVLLVAVAKYLGKNDELEIYDDSNAYAKACLLAYAEWMCGHEYPYLDKPDLLEYPNETWPAQDLRKSVIFYYAARYAEPLRRDVFEERGRYFYAAASEELARHSTSTFTRPLVLMLQNGWVGTRLAKNIQTTPVAGHEHFFGPKTPNFCISSVAKRIVGEFRQAINRFSLKREIAWLRARIG